ncbi:uncharacterized protein TrAtP1_009808 [Trichoderma atroviride]|uniref:Uncharacterized protein n=1 Tax=Hypocrea atroviridis (strain ATCC 20476 / IMI 206040) TaxID=452589 RepID=G9NKM6_HYPAI|nr:uncharacterized protein TRIATDRAFT_305270 [Trichoderma atroviride IMI 206040]EHK48449.1 hypothetical protein TRIATDRAFT_305270 [Trichoderma atroviride IMI 206040]UKZ68789.1 hypothetical protein TrAtP1_009808 [Trichoderma atroviride]
MAPTSIYQSFSEPVYRPNSPDTHHIAHTSGETTRNSEPPLFLLEVNASAWAQLANPILRQHEQDLQTIFFPTRETSAIYDTEGDVVAGATLELTHPVNVVLSAHMPSLLYGSEASKATARADRVYFKQNPGQEKRFYAVLDYKRVSVIIEEEFRAKIASSHTTFKRYMERGRDNSESQEEDGHVTNAETLLKQGVH